MKYELDIYTPDEKLPEPGKKIMVLGEQPGMNPSMSGKYWFKSHRIDPKDFKKMNALNIKNYDRNGFFAFYATHWCELPTKF